MPSIMLTHPRCDASLVAALTSPRDDVLVAEVSAAGSDDAVAIFDATAGPFRHYRRTVRVLAPRPSADEARFVTVNERIDFSIAAPLFGPIIGRLLAVTLRIRFRRRPGQPVDRVWWAPPARLTARQSTLLSIACLLAVIDGYPLGLLSQAGTFAAETFGNTSGDLADAQAVVRAMTALGLVAYPLADRFGRRPLTLWLSALGLIGAATSALAPSLGVVATTQGVSRAATTAATVILPILVAEEMPAGARAWATGVQAMSLGLGVGMVLWSNPLNDLGASWWRIQFAISLLGLPALLVLGRRLPESTRYTTLHEHNPRASDALVHQHIDRTRLALLGLALLALNAFVGPLSNLQTDFFRTERGFSATAASIFLVVTNTPGGLGVLAGGRLGDLRRRHVVVAVAIVGSAVTNTLMFFTSGAPMWLMSLLGSVLGGAAVPAVGALWQELFPTARRATASGMLTLAGLVGGFAGLTYASRVVDNVGYPTLFATLMVGPLLAVLALLRLPETASVRLEDLNAGELGRNESGDEGGERSAQR